MVIKVYISGICGSQDIRKHQQRVLFVLSMLPVDVDVVDVTEPGREDDRTFMQEEVKKHNNKTPLPPQIFNDKEYCGDYDDFQLACDDDVVMTFLKLQEPSESVSNGHVEEPAVTQNGISNASEIADQVELETSAESAKPEDVELAVTGEEIIDKVDIANDDTFLSDTKTEADNLEVSATNTAEESEGTKLEEKKEEVEKETKKEEAEEEEEESSEEEESEEEESD